MKARPVPPAAPRPPRLPHQHHPAGLGINSTDRSDEELLPVQAAALSAAPASSTEAVQARAKEDGDVVAFAVSAAHAEETDTVIKSSQHQQWCQPAQMLTEPDPEPEPALVPSSGQHTGVGGEMVSPRDARLAQTIALRIISLREELSRLGMVQLRQRASKEGLDSTEVDRSLESTRNISEPSQGETAQQALQERLAMHIAYRPVQRRGKMAKEGSVRSKHGGAISMLCCLASMLPDGLAVCPGGWVHEVSQPMPAPTVCAGR